MGGWMDGWVEGKAGLRIAYSNQKPDWKMNGSCRLYTELEKVQFLNECGI
jgi:hypothetical protein